MLERRLDIFVQTQHGVRRLFTYRRWMFLLPAALTLSLALGCLFLWPYRAGYEALSVRRQQALGRLAGQKAAALRLRERILRLEGEAARIGSFDGKLAAMLGASRERGGPGALPGRGADLVVGDSHTHRLLEFLEALGGRMAAEEVVQQTLAVSLAERRLEFLAKPSLWPAKGYITSGFGGRSSPFGRGGDFHNGVDIKVPLGSPVVAAGAGRVTEADTVNGYGLRVVVSHDFGLETVYAHLKKAEVKPGQSVRRGERIGLSGNSGRTTGAHLHYEVHAGGTPVNPRQYMLD
uniref:Metalloendopeptidase-like membrane protein n=1 Tax=Desulfovibrio sp. U5L TaxID=596152 RepID=I2PY72_9BACT